VADLAALNLEVVDVVAEAGGLGVDDPLDGGASVAGRGGRGALRDPERAGQQRQGDGEAGDQWAAVDVCERVHAAILPPPSGPANEASRRPALGLTPYDRPQEAIGHASRIIKAL
jgi:hypothetical protein